MAEPRTHRARRTRRAWAGSVAAASLVVTMASGANAAQPVAASDDRIDYELAAEMIEATWEVNDALAEIGMSAQDLVLPERDDDFYAQVAEGLSAWLEEQGALDTPDTDVASASVEVSPRSAQQEDAALTARRLAYATYIAQVNNARDPQAGDLASESIYMYLSHYVDTPRGFDDSSLGAHSNAIYLAAWLTPSDRSTYRTFLANRAVIDAADAAYQTASTILEIQPKLERVAMAVKGLSRASVSLAEVANDLPEIASGVSEIMDIWTDYAGSSSDDPAAVVAGLTDYGRWWDDEAAAQMVNDHMIGLFAGAASLAATGAGGPALVGAVAITEIHLLQFTANTLMERVSYTAMIATNSGRLSERMIRYMGW